MTSVLQLKPGIKLNNIQARERLKYYSPSRGYLTLAKVGILEH